MTIDTTKLKGISEKAAMMARVALEKDSDLSALTITAGNALAIAADILAQQAKIEEAFRRGVVEGETKQAKFEVQARAKFMKDLREGKIKP